MVCPFTGKHQHKDMAFDCHKRKGVALATPFDRYSRAGLCKAKRHTVRSAITSEALSPAAKAALPAAKSGWS